MPAVIGSCSLERQVEIHASIDNMSLSTGPVSQTKPAAATATKRQKLYDLFADRPMNDEELLVNLSLYMRSGPLSRLLFLNEIYQKIIHIPGIVCEFGVWWGQSLVIFENFRAVHEPYNHTRHMIGFDTFKGYPKPGSDDVPSETIAEGVYGVPEGYEHYLNQLMEYHQSENVMSHIRKHELVKGNAVVTAPKYFHERPEALVALAFFDMALYEPTKVCLEAIRPRLMSGSIVAFDELNNRDYPGETKAAIEVLGLSDFTVHRSQYLPDRTYFVLK